MRIKLTSSRKDTYNTLLKIMTKTIPILKVMIQKTWLLRLACSQSTCKSPQFMFLVLMLLFPVWTLQKKTLITGLWVAGTTAKMSRAVPFLVNLPLQRALSQCFVYSGKGKDFSSFFEFIIRQSVQFSRLVVSDFLRPHGLQYARPPCPSPTPGVHPDSCPSSQ